MAEHHSHATMLGAGPGPKGAAPSMPCCSLTPEGGQDRRQGLWEDPEPFLTDPGVQHEASS